MALGITGNAAAYGKLVTSRITSDANNPNFWKKIADAGNNGIEVGWASVFGSDAFTNNYNALRFDNIMIPKDTVIGTAYLLLTSNGNQANNFTATIYGEASATPAAFTSYADYAARSFTSATVSWELDAWTTEVVYQSPDIKTIIQEIVNLAGWKVGCSICLYLKNPNDADAKSRSHMAYNRGANVAAKLVIVPGDWTPPAPPEYEYDTTRSIGVVADDCTMVYGSSVSFDFTGPKFLVGANSGSKNSGLIFRNIQVPAEATITSAEMLWCSTENSYSTGCNMFIAAETVTNSSVFSTYEDFWGRSVTETGLGYTNLPSIEQDKWLVITGLAPLLQQVIDLPTWELGKAIGLRILDYSSTDGATRSFYAACTGTCPWEKMPILHIVWEL
jgi:predicted amidohydrolase